MSELYRIYYKKTTGESTYTQSELIRADGVEIRESGVLSVYAESGAFHYSRDCWQRCEPVKENQPNEYSL